MLIANPGPIGSPVVQILLWLLACCIEAMLAERLLRRRNFPKARVQSLALVVNLVSWWPFILVLNELPQGGLSFIACEIGVVIGEAIGLALVLRYLLPREMRGRVPSLSTLLLVSLATNVASIAVWVFLIVSLSWL